MTRDEREGQQPEPAPTNDDELSTDEFMERFYTGELMTVDRWWER
jgi:hypothetical protein